MALRFQGLSAKAVQNVPKELMGSTGEMEITRLDENEWKKMHWGSVVPPSTVQEVCLPMWRKSEIASQRRPSICEPGNAFLKERFSTTIDRATQAVEAWRHAKLKRMSAHPRSPDVVKVRANEENAYARVEQLLRIIKVPHGGTFDFPKCTIGHLVFATFGTHYDHDADVTNVLRGKLAHGRFERGLQADNDFLEINQRDVRGSKSSLDPTAVCYLSIYYIGKEAVFVDSFLAGKFVIPADNPLDPKNFMRMGILEDDTKLPKSRPLMKMTNSRRKAVLLGLREDVDGVPWSRPARQAPVFEEQEGILSEGRRQSAPVSGREWRFDGEKRATAPNPGQKWTF